MEASGAGLRQTDRYRQALLWSPSPSLGEEAEKTPPQPGLLFTPLHDCYEGPPISSSQAFFDERRTTSKGYRAGFIEKQLKALGKDGRAPTANSPTCIYYHPAIDHDQPSQYLQGTTRRNPQSTEQLPSQPNSNPAQPQPCYRGPDLVVGYNHGLAHHYRRPHRRRGGPSLANPAVTPGSGEMTAP